MSPIRWWQHSRASQILVVTAGVFFGFAAVLLLVVRHDVEQTVATDIRARVVTAAEVLQAFASSSGEMHVTKAGKLAFGATIQNGDAALVDRVKEVTGADVTVFQVIAGKPVPIATTLMADGRRILDGELAGPARAAFDKNQDFDGVSPVLGKPYVNHYAIIADNLGQPIGILYDGIPLDSATEAVSRTFVSILAAAISAISIVLILLWMIVRPLWVNGTALAADAEALAEGRAANIVTKPGKDELGRVAAAFARIVAYQRALGDHAEAIADGDLSRSVVLAGEGDRLGSAIARMTGTLREVVLALQTSSSELTEHARAFELAASRSAGVVTGVGVAVRELASGSSELSTAAETSNVIVRQFESAIDGIARGAVDQAMQVRAASGDAQRMAGDVERVAAISSDLAAAGDATRTTAQRGAKAVTETIEDMRAIQLGVAGAAAKIRELGDLSAKIGVVVETIDALTDQTNLLALNAAIEAARAGEHGRGFAVVADEVRTLAESASHQTREIGGLIVEVQRRTLEAVGAAESGAVIADRGAAKVGAASAALGDIIAAVDKTVARVGEIAAAMREMSDGARNVGRSMDSINAVVEENSTATEEMASQTGHLAGAIGAIASTAQQNARNTADVSSSAVRMEDDIARVRAEAQTLAATAARMQGLVSRFRLGRPELAEAYDFSLADLAEAPPPELPHPAFAR
jgi:methyl-accepting chemotaxis protein